MNKKIKVLINTIYATMLVAISGCFMFAKSPTNNSQDILPNITQNITQMANGGLGFIRTTSLIGIGAVMFFACWNSMKIYIAAIIGLGTSLALTTVCMYYEKWFALVMFIALGVVFLLAIASLFVKHKGIFLAWTKR